ncbi:hypothetical protein NDA18_004492 [Ustilago nuda]|nr:hypothetical protein NDA18_004492 [Ustilago nuda]
MKLSGMFRIGFVAAIVTALILLPSCIAAGSSAPGSSGEASTRPRQLPKINKYTLGLNIDNINRLSLNRLGLDEQARIFGDVPFFYSKDFKTPLYSIETPTETVEQALQYYRSVGIVDVPENKAILIRVRNDGYRRYLEQSLFSNIASDPIKLFQLNHNLHRLRNHVRTSSIPVPPPHDVAMEYIPHLDDKPIITQDSEEFHHMLYASYTNSRKFYYIQPGQDTILVDAHADELFSNLNVNEREKIQRALTGYSAAKQNYGKEIASLIWGEPIKANVHNEGGRTLHIPLTEYPRLPYGATRANMLLKLNQNGRFRIYRKIDAKKYAYEVKVKNPGATQGEALEVYVKPLSRLERIQERLLALAGKIKLPWVAELRASHRR